MHFWLPLFLCHWPSLLKIMRVFSKEQDMRSKMVSFQIDHGLFSSPGAKHAVPRSKATAFFLERGRLLTGGMPIPLIIADRPPCIVSLSDALLEHIL
jgi:hypothetical protein